MIVQLLVLHMYVILKEEDTILVGVGANLFKQLKPGGPELDVRKAWCYIAGLNKKEGRVQPMRRRAGRDEVDGGRRGKFVEPFRPQLRHESMKCKPKNKEGRNGGNGMRMGGGKEEGWGGGIPIRPPRPKHKGLF